MAGDTVTLALQGDDVSLEHFADAVGRFSRLIAALSKQANAPHIRWEIEDLEVGSTTTTARAAALNGHQPEQVDRVVSAYLEVGRALQHHQTIPYPPPVKVEALGLAGLLEFGVQAVRFETAEADAIVREPATQQKLPPTVIEEARPTYGAVTGRVQTLSSRSRLRFTLYDRLYDKPVSCYLAEGSESQMRNAWDRVATVEGLVSRDPPTGRPLAVRQIRNIELLEEAEPTGYQRARGALPRHPDKPRAEHRIRQLRDAG